MFAPLASLTALALAALAIAQSPSSSAPGNAPTTTAGISQCVINCSEQAASGRCSSFADLSCVCTSIAFQQAANACLAANCTAADMAAALALQTGECANVPGAVSAPVPSASGAPGNSSSSSSSSPAASGAHNSSSTPPAPAPAPTNGTSSSSAPSSPAPSSPAPAPTNAGNGALAAGVRGAAVLGGVLAVVGLVL